VKRPSTLMMKRRDSLSRSKSQPEGCVRQPKPTILFKAVVPQEEISPRRRRYGHNYGFKARSIGETSREKQARGKEREAYLRRLEEKIRTKGQTAANKEGPLGFGIGQVEEDWQDEDDDLSAILKLVIQEEKEDDLAKSHEAKARGKMSDADRKEKHILEEDEGQGDDKLPQITITTTDNHNQTTSAQSKSAFSLSAQLYSIQE